MLLTGLQACPSAGQGLTGPARNAVHSAASGLLEKEANRLKLMEAANL